MKKNFQKLFSSFKNNLRFKVSRSSVKNFFQDNFLTRRGLKSTSYWLFLFIPFLILSLVILTIIIYILVQGLPYIKWNFLWKDYNPSDLKHSGVAPFVVSTLLIIVFTIIIAFPVSLFAAIYLNSPHKSIVKKILNFLMMLLNSIPSLVIGLVGLSLFVETLRLGYVGFSIIAGAFTLCFVVLPTMTFGFLESFNTVSKDTIYNCYALGATSSQINFKMIIPLAKNGIISTIILTVNRIIGESAPLLLTMGGAYFLPHNIFDQGRTLTAAVYLLFQESRDPYAVHFAYAMIIIILLIIIVLNFTAKQIINKMNVSSGIKPKRHWINKSYRFLLSKIKFKNSKNCKIKSTETK
ncbi:PstA family ABC transporter permease [Mycoplasma sp. SG1]|uniref:PstA family ABC transporter permease n=1 Tax=Mycoplasma sp. SG1 TaxID=2810348 RepID=UPI002024946D|nr:ABC transporter permease subunit [Mycoplasma sp. SG1]